MIRCTHKVHFFVNLCIGYSQVHFCKHFVTYFHVHLPCGIPKYISRLILCINFQLNWFLYIYGHFFKKKYVFTFFICFRGNIYHFHVFSIVREIHLCHTKTCDWGKDTSSLILKLVLSLLCHKFDITTFQVLREYETKIMFS